MTLAVAILGGVGKGHLGEVGFGFGFGGGEGVRRGGGGGEFLGGTVGNKVAIV